MNQSVGQKGSSMDSACVQLAHAKDVINMSEEGIAALFVNPHGYVHDMVTLRKVRTKCWHRNAVSCQTCPFWRCSCQASGQRCAHRTNI